MALILGTACSIKRRAGHTLTLRSPHLHSDILPPPILEMLCGKSCVRTNECCCLGSTLRTSQAQGSLLDIPGSSAPACLFHMTQGHAIMGRNIESYPCTGFFTHSFGNKWKPISIPRTLILVGNTRLQSLRTHRRQEQTGLPVAAARVQAEGALWL